MKKIESLSIFFPAYNDEGTIEKMVEDARIAAMQVTKDFEIIVVDDKSPDNSGKIADKLAKKYSFVKVIHHKKNKGYGGALKSGFNASTKKWVFYTDGDAQYDAGELKKLVKKLDAKTDVVNGFKIKRSDAFYRIFLGGAYNMFSRLMFGIKIRDIDCDFRLMRREIFDNIILESNSGVICVEMIKKIQDNGYRFNEVPVHHYPRTSGNSQFFKIGRLLKVFYGLAIQWFKLVVFRRGKNGICKKIQE